jgi:transglutaminase-like putative cysteine protease
LPSRRDRIAFPAVPKPRFRTPWILCAAACAGPTEGRDVSDLFADTASYRVEHTVHVPVPPGSRSVRVWVPLPPGFQGPPGGVARAMEVRRGRDLRGDEEHQTIYGLEIEPASWVTARDQHGNRYAYVAADGPQGDVSVKVTFEVERREVNAQLGDTRALSNVEQRHYAGWLAADDDDEASAALAAGLRGEATDPLQIARALFDWTLAAERAPVLPEDLAAQWTALARRCGIPVRTVHGSLLPPGGAALEPQDASWCEAWFPELGWVPVDVARAVAHRRALDAAARPGAAPPAAILGCRPEARSVDYYFGNLDGRRVTWSQGRGQRPDPSPAGRIDAIVGAHVEIDGVPTVHWRRTQHVVELRRR